jgi:hypothetical protein
MIEPRDLRLGKPQQPAQGQAVPAVNKSWNTLGSPDEQRVISQLRSDLRFCLFTQLAAKRFHFALGAFIKPVMAGYNLSSLMLGSNQAPFYSPVSFVFRQCDGPATHFMSLLPRWNPACVPGQANSRAKTDQEKDSSRHTRNSGYRGLLSYCR